ncbi:hypothetical protein EBR43_13005, partial [bacterium]|nr:hypothetical protein [bacterium]
GRLDSTDIVPKDLDAISVNARPSPREPPKVIRWDMVACVNREQELITGSESILFYFLFSAKRQGNNHAYGILKIFHKPCNRQK